MAKDYGIKIKYSDLWWTECCSWTAQLSRQKIFLYFITQNRLILKVVEELMRLIAYLMSFLCEEYHCIFVCIFKSVYWIASTYLKKSILKRAISFFFYKWLKDCAVKARKWWTGCYFWEYGFPFDEMFLICIFKYVESTKFAVFGGKLWGVFHAYSVFIHREFHCIIVLNLSFECRSVMFHLFKKIFEFLFFIK